MKPIAPRRIDPRVIDLAERAGLDPSLDRDGGLAEPVMLRRHQEPVGLAQRVAHGENFRGGNGERLFANDMLARIQGRDDRRRMDLVRRANIDRVDFLQLQQIAVIGENQRNGKISRKLLHRCRADIARRHDLNIGHRQPTRFEMCATNDAARTDESYFQFPARARVHLNHRSNLYGNLVIEFASGKIYRQPLGLGNCAREMNMRAAFGRKLHRRQHMSITIWFPEPSVTLYAAHGMRPPASRTGAGRGAGCG
jgi:hypothetical protein